MTLKSPQVYLPTIPWRTFPKWRRRRRPQGPRPASFRPEPNMSTRESRASATGLL